MCRPPLLQRRGAVSWFRCKISVVLIPHYGKRETLQCQKQVAFQYAQCHDLVQSPRMPA